MLVIDDNASICELVARLLKSECDVDCCHSVREGLRHLQACPPDLVLMDVDMPGKNGIQGLCEIREVEPDLPVVMMTGSSPLDQRLEALPYLHVRGLLRKPFTPEQLRQAVFASAADLVCVLPGPPQLVA